jgi:tRNA (guanine-N7-)-methyltransferase
LAVARLNRRATASFYSVIELAQESCVAPLDLLAIFGRPAPLHVDLGCGDGSFLCELAGRFPSKNFLGIERLAGRVAKTAGKAANVDNVRVLHAETAYAVRYLLPGESVETFYLFFPDPWPKRRHHRRRIFTKDFLNSILRALEPNGLLRVATDHLDYFRQIERCAADPLKESSSKFDCLNQSSSPWFEMDNRDDAQLPSTKFEKKFCAQGAPIYRLTLRKVSPVT